MKLDFDDIKDDEIRIIGEDFIEKDKEIESYPSNNGEPNIGKKGRRISFWKKLLVIPLLFVLICPFAIYLESEYHKNSQARFVCDRVEGAQLMDYSEAPDESQVEEAMQDAYVNEFYDTLENVHLRILNPTAGKLSLLHGVLPHDKKIIMAASAADIRADNGEIAGAYVYKGELLSRGHSKQGFCAIIDGEVFLGRQSETPLLERALDQDGYFFRQYSLVHNGQMGETTPPGRSIRRALCMKKNHPFIIESTDPVSYEDFSNALIQEEVDEAIALMGAIPLAQMRLQNGKRILHDWPVGGKNANYIIWSY